MTRHSILLVLGAVLCSVLLPACQSLPKCCEWLRPAPNEKTVDNKSKKTPKDKETEIAKKPETPPVESGDPDATPYHLIKHPFGKPERKKPAVKPLWLPDLDWPEPIREQHPPEILPPLHLQTPLDLKPLPEPIRQALPPPENQEPLVEALSCFLKNQPQDALRYLERYDQDTRELFQRVLPPLTLLTRKKLSDMTPEEVTAVQVQLQELLIALRGRTSLSIQQICFCESVKGFGDYKAFPPGHAFQPPSGRRLGELVQVYAELKNVASERRDLFYESRLNSSVEIRDAKGNAVVTRNFGDRDRPLRSVTLRNDYYNNYRFYVPQLPAGKYELTIQVIDETSRPHRAARKSLEFIVAAPSGDL